jgi:phosphate:Na+ symporter
LTPYLLHGTFVFVVIGFVLTSIIQSSSAVVAIALTALHANVITFPSAASIVIGGEVGTTLTILLWGIKGSADKKRTAWGNFGFNIFTAVTAYITLHLLIFFYEGMKHIQDPLVSLVLFQTSINILSIILFIPFLNSFSSLLERIFISGNSNGNSFISKNLPLMPLLATDTLRNEALFLLNKTLLFSKNILWIEQPQGDGFLEKIKSLTWSDANVEEDYNHLKQKEGDILGYYADIQENNLEKQDATILLEFVSAARQSVFAAKAIKDITHNLKDFKESGNDILFQQYLTIGSEWFEFNSQIINLLNLSGKNEIYIGIDKALNAALENEENHKVKVFLYLKNGQVNEVEASTMMNVHRELLSCKKSLLLALYNLETKVSTN